MCSGWVPSKKPEGGIYGYATDDIFFLEVCLYTQNFKNSCRGTTKGRRAVKLAPATIQFTSIPEEVFTRACKASPAGVLLQ